jgi:hypothetical protein
MKTAYSSGQILRESRSLLIRDLGLRSHDFDSMGERQTSSVRISISSFQLRTQVPSIAGGREFGQIDWFSAYHRVFSPSISRKAVPECVVFKHQSGVHRGNSASA